MLVQRALQKDGTIDGAKVGGGLQKPQGPVVRAFRFGALPDPEPNKKRRLFEDPPAEKCERDIHECAAGPRGTCCGKWHSEVIFALALRPPFPGPGVPGAQLQEGKAGGGPDFPPARHWYLPERRPRGMVVRAATWGGNTTIPRGEVMR